MKRVLFHYPVLNRGGAEMSSLRMMKALADRGWAITLVLTVGGGQLEPDVDPRVRIVRLRPRAYGARFFSACNLHDRFFAMTDLAAYTVMRGLGAINMLPFLFRHYEAAAVLLMGTSSFFVRRVVRAKVKVQWIRNDLAGADPTGRIAKVLASAEPGLDRFLCVSEVARQSLVRVVPGALNKADVLYNILDAAAMRQKGRIGNDPFPPGEGKTLRVLTVCRLNDRAKGLMRMVRVCRRLVDAGLSFVWYVAGAGPDRESFQHAILEAGLADKMVLMGNLPNPFPAYRHADLVAMLSHYEGLCGVVNEARIMERPVIATMVSGIDEQLTSEVNGLVVDNNEDAIVAGMTRLLTDATLRERLAVGGYPPALLDDGAKLERLEAVFGGLEPRA